jgi:hypothetical protein
VAAERTARHGAQGSAGCQFRLLNGGAGIGEVGCPITDKVNYSRTIAGNASYPTSRTIKLPA